VELASFLGAHSPFQSMDRDEREALAAGSSFQDFAAGEIVTDYSSQVPDDIWMVCTGHVTLQGSTDGATIDSVEPGGIFGYMPMLTGGGM
jgi:CBS domain-containing protein